MFTLLKLELEKLVRARSFYLSFIVLIGFVALMLWGFYTYAARKTGGLLVTIFFYVVAPHFRVHERRLADRR